MNTNAGRVGGNQTPTELIRKLIARSGPEGGSVFLSDFCKQLGPEVPRSECVAALKNNRDVLFVVGRKGHQSRAIFGRMRNNYTQAPSFKSPVASGPIRQHTPRPRQQEVAKQRFINRVLPVVSAEGTALDATKFRLRVVVNGQEVFVPVDQLELVAA